MFKLNVHSYMLKHLPQPRTPSEVWTRI